MKNISNMRKYRTRSNAVILRVLALLVLSCVGASAWADEYHLFFKYSNENPSSFEDMGAGTDIGSGTYAWTVTLPANQNSNYYFAVSTSNSYVNMISFDKGNVTNNTTEIANGRIGNQSYNIGNITYNFVYINREDTKAAYTMRILFSYDNETPSFTLEDAVSCSMQIKHSWNGGSQTWQTMTSAGSNVYTYVGQYGGSNVCQISNDAGSNYTQYNATVTGAPSTGDYCTFSFTSTGSCATSGGTMEITKVTASEYYVPGNGANGNLSNWCNGVDWYVDSEKDKINMTQIGANLFSITYSSVSNTNGTTNAEFKVKNGSNWYNGWDNDTSEANGNTISVDGNVKILIPQANKEQNITITFNSNNNTIHVKCTDVATLPEIYIGEQPQKEGNTLAGSVYLAQTGGATITDIRVYYEKDAEPNVSTSPYVTLAGPFACGNLYPFTIDEICTIGSGDYQIKAQATNSAGSQASDVVAFNNFVCCPGSIETLAVKPEAESVIAGESYGFFATIEGGGANPTYLWEIKIGDGEWETQSSRAKDMYYPVPENVPGGTNIYVRVTATGSNCEDTRTANTMVTACYTPAILSLVGPEDDPYAWDNINVTAAITNSSYYEWSVNPTATLINPSATGVTFKGGTVNKSETDYTVTLTIGENQCGNKVSKDVEIRVKPDKDNCTPAP